MSSPGTEDTGGAAFKHAFRGYETAAVDTYVAELTHRLTALEREHAAAVARLVEFGETDREQQIDQLTQDIGRILHAARTAAENLKTRAETESVQLQAGARDASSRMLEQAEADAYELRKDAWETASKLLDDVTAHVAEVRRQADQDALDIVGESERNAHRKLAAARRDAENQLRAARLEGERIRVEAQGERDELIDNARRTSEAAQERTRALERRRDELLHEIERLQQSGTAEPGAAEIASTTVRVVRPGDRPRGSWTGNKGAREPWPDGAENIRLVQPVDKDPVEFLDGDSIADEVRRLRDAGDETDPSRDRDEAATVPGSAAAVAAEETEQSEPDAGLELESAAAGEPGLDRGESEADVPDPEPVAAAASNESEPTIEEVATSEPARDEPIAEVRAAAGETEPDGDATSEIEMLFGQLRGSELPQPRPQLEILPERIDPASMGTEVSEDTPLEELVVPEPIDPFDVRDRLLLPITNRLLRAVKRELSDAQNVALEGLRLDPEGWQPDLDPFTVALRPEFAILENETFGAGAAAAAELLSATGPRPKSNASEGDPAAELARDLAEALGGALEAGRSASQGARQLSSSASRVYRAWRTDEAERRIRSIAMAGYHLGMRAAYAEADVQKLRVVVAGAGCVDCRASAEHLIDPTDATVALPPLHAGCGCTLLQN